MTLVGIARIVHEANRAYCISIGDSSQPSWDEAPDWQQQSALAGVMAVLNGDVDGPEASHESWLATKHADGWRWGGVKDPEVKEHPCMVPYKDLPEEQKVKDHLFLAIVNELGKDLA